MNVLHCQIGHEVDEDEYENEGKDASYEPPSDLLYDSDYGTHRRG